MTSTPNRILDSRAFNTFMDWFELFAVAFFLLIPIGVLLFGVAALLWWALS